MTVMGAGSRLSDASAGRACARCGLNARTVRAQSLLRAGASAFPAGAPAVNARPDSPSIVGVAVRDLARLRTVAVTVAKHGFGPLLMRIPLAGRLFDRPPEGDASLRDVAAPVRFARLLAALGPTWIKLGQILSMRKDLSRRSGSRRSRRCRTTPRACPSRRSASRSSRASAAGSRSSTTGFDEQPLGTASIAQTHRARTKDGTRWW